MPTPQPGQENEEEWVARCMSSDEAMEDFPDEDQRFAFCQSEWDEATAENMQAIHQQITARPQRDELMGMSGWSIPATALRDEIVMHNNLGKMRVPGDEIERSSDRWKMTPVTLGHPRERGVPTSGRDPDAVNDRGVGFFTEPQVVDGELKGTVFLAEDRLEEMGATSVLNAVRSGEPVEVSTGFGGNFREESGHHDGQQFDVVAHDLEPDHFAILLDEEGACSVEDGCGLGINHDGPCEGDDMKDTDAENAWERIKSGLTALVQAENHNESPENEGDEMADNETDEDQTTEPEAQNEEGGEQEQTTDQPPEWAENLVSTVESLNERMDELEDAAEPALNEAQQERNRLTSEIAQNSDFEEDELEEWQLGDLRTMRKSLAGSSPGRPGPKAHNTGSGETDFMPPTDAFAENSEGEE